MLFRSRTAALILIVVGTLFLLSNLGWIPRRSILPSMVAADTHHRGSLDVDPTILASNLLGEPHAPCSRQAPHMSISESFVKNVTLPIAISILVVLGAYATSSSRVRAGGPVHSDALFETVSALDTAAFESFNKCSAPEQLQRHASYFASDVEFYHDTGGVT